MIRCSRMKLTFLQSHNLFRLPATIFILAVLFFGSFCFTPNTASAHGGREDMAVESGYLHQPTNQECCHAALHEKNHESAKGVISNRQSAKQMAVAHTSDVFDLTVNCNSNFGYSGYSKKYTEGISPPASILRC